MVQLVGYYVWRKTDSEVNRNDILDGIEQAKDRLGILVFEASLGDVSEKDLALSERISYVINKEYESKIKNEEFSILHDNFHWISEPDKGVYIVPVDCLKN
jgi:hypothetical protein